MSQQNYTRLQFLMKYLGINKSHIAKDTGLTYAHVRDSTVPQNFSSWLKFALWVFDEMLSIIEGLKKEIEELKATTEWSQEPIEIKRVDYTVTDSKGKVIHDTKKDGFISVPEGSVEAHLRRGNMYKNK